MKYFLKTWRNNSINVIIKENILLFLLLFAFIILICFIVGPELVHSIKEIIRLEPNAYDQFIQTLKDNRNIMNGSFKNMIDSIISLDIDLSSLYKTIVNNWQTLFHSGLTIPIIIIPTKQTIKAPKTGINAVTAMTTPINKA